MSKFIHNDIKILKVIQDDSPTRLSLSDIAERIGVGSSSTIHERLAGLQEQGVIRNWSAVLDPKKIGIEIIAFAGIVLRQHNAETLCKFEAAITDSQTFPEILECYSLTGSYDYLLKVAVASIDAYSAFLHEKLVPLDTIASVHSQIVLREVRFGTKLPLTHLKAGGQRRSGKRRSSFPGV